MVEYREARFCSRRDLAVRTSHDALMWLRKAIKQTVDIDMSHLGGRSV